MGRLGSILFALLFLLLLMGMVGCGGGGGSSGPVVPAAIKLSPTSGSLDLGTTLQLSAIVTGSNQQSISIPVSFESSNPGIVTVASNGLICAGSWDSLAAPVVCIPKGVGIAQVTASASGVTSAPISIYVHQHIDQLRIAVVPALPGSLPPGPGGCLSAASTTAAAQTQIYQATAYSQGLDITSTVGPITWTQANAQVATVSNTAAGLTPLQAEATASTPGTTQILASVGDANSTPVDVNVCAVQSIVLSVGGTGGTTISGTKGNSATVQATVTDISQKILTKAPLTWASTNSVVASVPTTPGLSATVSGSNVGGTTITASCIPPGCNLGIVPMQAIYPTEPVTAAYSTSGTSTAPTTFIAYSTTTNSQCDPTKNCNPLLAQISGSPIAANAVLGLPAIPNSLRFTPAGDKLFLGSEKGLMFVNPTATPPSVVSFTSVTGKVLAISPNGTKVIVSDTQPVFPNPPTNQVFIFDTTSNSSISFPITGATAAAFSPDNLKAFIVAGSTLWVYSPQAALQSIPLLSPATEVGFLGSGIAGYMTGPSGMQLVPTCEDPATSPLVSTVPASGTFLRTLPGNSLLTLVPPNVEIVSASVTGPAPALGNTGCPAPFPNAYLSISNSVTFSPLGQGTFTPVDLAVSTDGQKAYVLIANQGSVVVLDILARTISSIPLVGSPAPLAESLTPDGLTLFVTGNDNVVHVIDTVSGQDLQQAPIPATTLCSLTTGGPPPACLPDLLAVKP